MIWLGQIKAGTVIPYALRFHDDTGTAADPTTPTARLRATDGTWSNLTAPAQLDATTGLYGGTIDTTGQGAGIYLVSVSGTVATSKTVGAVIGYQIIANTEADVMSRLGTPVGADLSADIAGKASQTSVDTMDAVVDAVKLKTDLIPNDPATETTVNTRLASTEYTAPDNASITAIKAKTDLIPATPATEGNVTAVGIAVSAVDGVVDAIKLKTDNLPADPASNTQVNTRLATTSYTAPDNTTIGTIKTALDTKLDTTVSSRLATAGYTAPDNVNIGLIKAKTDLIPADPLTAAQVDSQLSSIHGSGQWGVSFTAGTTKQFIYTLTRTDNGLAIAGASVSVTIDAAGNTLVANAVTNSNGQVVFYLEPGTYYLWRQKAGYNFINPDTEVIV